MAECLHLKAHEGTVTWECEHTYTCVWDKATEGNTQRTEVGWVSLGDGLELLHEIQT